MRSSPGRRRPLLSGDTGAPDGSASLVGFLNAPLIGLQPFVQGPLYSQAIDCYWQSFDRFDREAPFWIQRTLPREFRNIVAREAHVSSHVVRDPREVPEHLRSERWAALCRGIENWNDLPVGRQARLTALLHALCFYRLTLKLTSERTMRLTDADGVLLAYWRASAAYVMDLPSRVSQYSFADMSDFEKMARDGRVHPAMQFLSSIKLLVHQAKTGGRAEVLRAAATRSEALLGEAGRARPFLGHLYTSHFHRAVAMVSQAEGKAFDVERHMGLAERHARAMRPRSPAERLLYRENLHPVLESRCKESIWRGQYRRAVELARKVISVDPYDPKSWVELGEALALSGRLEEAAEAYASASVLGPPGSAIGLHMAGVCSHRAGRPLMGYFFFLQSAGRDSATLSSISHALAMERSASLPFRPGTDAWLRRTIMLD
jgi:tetratricopeptide (TPR) repeat protein